MTEDRMALIDLIEMGADGDLVRDLLAYVVERMMELEVEARTGAPTGQRSAERLTQRNGYRERASETRAGRIDREDADHVRAALDLAVERSSVLVEAICGQFLSGKAM